MAIVSKQTKEMHSMLTKVFSAAFAQAQKEGVDVKNIHWFNSESKKDAKNAEEQRQSA